MTRLLVTLMAATVIALAAGTAAPEADRLLPLPDLRTPVVLDLEVP